MNDRRSVGGISGGEGDCSVGKVRVDIEDAHPVR
jgi:hypothetical protein